MSTTPPPETPSNPVHAAVDTFTKQMDRQLADAEAKNIALQINNGSMLAEINMLREQLADCEAGRQRFQSIASALAGELAAIKDVIDGATRRAIKAGTTPDKQAPAEAEKPADAPAAVPAPDAPISLAAPQPAPEPVAAPVVVPQQVSWATR